MKDLTKGILFLIILSPIIIPTIVITFIARVAYEFAVMTWNK